MVPHDQHCGDEIPIQLVLPDENSTATPLLLSELEELVSLRQVAGSRAAVLVQLVAQSQRWTVANADIPRDIAFFYRDSRSSAFVNPAFASLRPTVALPERSSALHSPPSPEDLQSDSGSGLHSDSVWSEIELTPTEVLLEIVRTEVPLEIVRQPLAVGTNESVVLLRSSVV